MRKLLFSTLFACVMAGTLLAEGISLMPVEQWKPYAKSSTISAGADGTLVFHNPKGSENSQVFQCDGDALYKITGMIRSSKKKGAMRLALKLRDTKKRQVSPMNYLTVPASLTELVEAAPKGSKTLKLKNMSGWNKKVFGGCLLALDAREDGSDLPNFRLLPVKILKATEENGTWTVELEKPIAVDLPQGMTVRQHLNGGANYIGKQFQSLTTEWTPFTVTLEGIDKGTVHTIDHFPANTAAFQIILQILWTDPDQTVEIKDMTITQE